MIEIVKKQIEDFLNNEQSEVLALKGPWGVGKTFSWIKFLNKARNENKIKYKKYSYVSLFGINSLEELKFSIFEKVIDTDLIGADVTIETFKSNAEQVLKTLGRKITGYVQSIPSIKKFGSIIESLAFLSINNILICIDDFERKGINLDARDVLGLISVLKEQKGCKVVLIFNDESFEGKSKKEYEMFREKVIDIELKFNPVAKECAELALPLNDDVSVKLKSFIDKLGINNIRIIKKIERLALKLKELLSEYEEEVFHQACHTLTLFSLSYYNHDESIPPLEYITKKANLFLPDEENNEGNELKWKLFLREYEYTSTDEFDLVILKFVESGWIDERELLAAAQKLNKQIIASKSEDSFSKKWDLFHNSFKDNEEEVIRELSDSLKKNVHIITPGGLDGAVRLFRKLGQEEKAEEVIDFYIKARSESKELFDLDNYPFPQYISDQGLMSSFREHYDSFRIERTLESIIDNISSRQNWDKEDEDVLSNASPEEYYQLFKTVEGKKLSSYIDSCLQFGRFSNASEKQIKISQNATEALKKIGKESRLNAMRIQKYGISVED